MNQSIPPYIKHTDFGDIQATYSLEEVKKQNKQIRKMDRMLKKGAKLAKEGKINIPQDLIDEAVEQAIKGLDREFKKYL